MEYIVLLLLYSGICANYLTPTNNELLESQKVSEVVGYFFMEKHYSPLPFEENPRELIKFFSKEKNILMSPSSNLSLLLSKEFDNITVVDTHNSVLRFTSFLHQNYSNNTGTNFIEKIQKNFCEFCCDYDIDSALLSKYFEKSYDKIDCTKNVKVGLENIFDNIPHEPSIIFLSTLLERETENLEKNLSRVVEWIEGGHEVLWSLTAQSFHDLSMLKAIGDLATRYCVTAKPSSSFPGTMYYHVKKNNYYS